MDQHINKPGVAPEPAPSPPRACSSPSNNHPPVETYMTDCRLPPPSSFEIDREEATASPDLDAILETLLLEAQESVDKGAMESKENKGGDGPLDPPLHSQADDVSSVTSDRSTTSSISDGAPPASIAAIDAWLASFQALAQEIRALINGTGPVELDEHARSDSPPATCPEDQDKPPETSASAIDPDQLKTIAKLSLKLGDAPYEEEVVEWLACTPTADRTSPQRDAEGEEIEWDVSPYTMEELRAMKADRDPAEIGKHGRSHSLPPATVPKDQDKPRTTSGSSIEYYRTTATSGIGYQVVFATEGVETKWNVSLATTARVSPERDVDNKGNGEADGHQNKDEEIEWDVSPCTTERVSPEPDVDNKGNGEADGHQYEGGEIEWDVSPCTTQRVSPEPDVVNKDDGKPDGHQAMQDCLNRIRDNLRKHLDGREKDLANPGSREHGARQELQNSFDIEGKLMLGKTDAKLQMILANSSALNDDREKLERQKESNRARRDRQLKHLGQLGEALACFQEIVGPAVMAEVRESMPRHDWARVTTDGMLRFWDEFGCPMEGAVWDGASSELVKTLDEMVGVLLLVTDEMGEEVRDRIGWRLGIQRGWPV